MKKLLSVLILFNMMMSLFCVPSFAEEISGYTEEYLGDRFTRLVMTDKAFNQGTARTFTVNIEEDSDYTVFISQTAHSDNTNFAVSFSDGTENIKLTTGTTASTAYRYEYVRVGADTLTSASKDYVTLSKGTWTLSVTSMIDSTVNYIDIRSVKIPVDGSKQAIYPSDYHTIKRANGDTHVGENGYINSNLISTELIRFSGFRYFADYLNSNLANKYERGRGIHVYYDRTVSYKLDVAKAGLYAINLNAKFVVRLKDTANEINTSAVITATGNETKTLNHTFAAGASGTASIQYETYYAYLNEGENYLTVKTANNDKATFKLCYISLEKVSGMLGDDFTRIVPENGEFNANREQTFNVDIPKDGDYAVFVNKKESEATNFVASFSNGTQTVSVLNGTEASDAYGYNYVRLGALNESSSCHLTKGAWTFSLKPLSDMNISYIDIRNTEIPAGEEKIAVYPSDYNSMSIAKAEDVNGQLSNNSYTLSKDEYYADYTNDYAKGIVLASGKTVNYELNAKESQRYKICIKGAFASESGNLTVTAGTSSQTFQTGETTFLVNLTEGINTLSLSADSDFALSYITVEESDPDKENTYVLAKTAVVNFINNARKFYGTEEYSGYDTSLITQYISSATTAKNGTYDSPNSVSLSWDAIDGADSYTLYVSQTSDFSKNVRTVENITETSIDLYNLYTDTVYYWKVVGGGKESEVSKFYTDDTVRYVYADGLRNARDIGGWNGLNQGLAYRGGRMDDDGSSYKFFLSDSGKETMMKDLGIKTDLDFRASLTESPLGSGVELINISIGAYDSAFNNKNYAQVLSTFADSDNYPIYYHCQGGADRTGTVSVLLEALCGVSEADLAIDFELTSFSPFGYRYRNNEGDYPVLISTLKSYEGASLQEKAENYAKSIGLTRSEISNIQSILSGNGVTFESISDVVIGENVSVSLENIGSNTVSSVKINGNDVDYTQTKDGIVLTLEEKGECEISFADGNSIKFTVVENPYATTKYDFEDYYPYISSTRGQISSNDYADEDKFLYDRKSTEDSSFSFDVTIGKSGYYDIVYVASDRKVSTASKMKFTLENESGQTLIGTNADAEGEIISPDWKGYASTSYARKYEKNMWLDEGTYKLLVDVPVNSDNIVYCLLDYISFTLLPPPSISSTDSTKFNFEDYYPYISDTRGQVSTSNYADGQQFLRDTRSTEDSTFGFEVNVEKSGFYNVNYVSSDKKTSSASALTFKLGKTTIGVNSKTEGAVIEGWDGYASAFVMRKYEKEAIWLEAGVHTLSVDAALNVSNKIVFYLDYIEFEPATRLKTEGTNITASVCYEKALSGTPILALYNGDNLVVAKAFDEVTDTKKVQLAIETSEAFTKAKVFLWSDMKDMIPQAETTVFNK